MIAPPLDLRADAGAPTPRPKKTNVADEMLSGMKSMFHSVLPKETLDPRLTVRTYRSSGRGLPPTRARPLRAASSRGRRPTALL